MRGNGYAWLIYLRGFRVKKMQLSCNCQKYFNFREAGVFSLHFLLLKDAAYGACSYFNCVSGWWGLFACCAPLCSMLSKCVVHHYYLFVPLLCWP